MCLACPRLGGGFCRLGEGEAGVPGSGSAWGRGNFTTEFAEVTEFMGTTPTPPLRALRELGGKNFLNLQATLARAQSSTVQSSACSRRSHLALISMISDSISMKQATKRGSKWFPEPRSSSARAASIGQAFL
ncbi:hypothetical protein SCOR_05585 [Sulfidibacter corallicola]